MRKVSRDAFVSWDGSRYGVPWQWAGEQVVVKDRGGYVEIWTVTGDRCIYRHPKSLVKGAIVQVPGQYDGIPLSGDTREWEAVAQRVAAPDVQVRPLSAYEALAGGSAG